MSIDPNRNHIDKDEVVKKEEKEEVEKDIPGYEEDDILAEDITNNKSVNNKIAQEQFRVKMIKLFVVAIILVVVIIFIGYLFSGGSSKNKSYSDVEEIMVNATRSYFNDNKSKLPADKKSVYITVETLSNGKYMKPIEKYLKNDSCSGKVVVKNESNSYDYTAYLDCGNSYKTVELYKEITKKDNIVTNGYGLYKINDSYIYRGLDVNNYVKFKDNDNDNEILWRIIKVINDGEVVLIKDSITNSSYEWDNRYNSSTKRKTGINVYQNSSISIHMEKLYKGNFDNESMKYKNEEVYFNKYIKSKLKKHNACVGVRSINDTSKDGSSECKTTYETKMSLLAVYDFINASIDPGCTKTTSPECQNYNYLSKESGYWLGNGVLNNSSQAYYISSGYIREDDAYSNNYIRPVIHLNDNVMIESGKGTKDKPYIIR